MKFEDGWTVYTFDEMMSTFIPTAIYIKDNVEHKEKLSQILIAYLGGNYEIQVENDIWKLKYKS